MTSIQPSTEVRHMRVIIPEMGELAITWECKHGVWFIVGAIDSFGKRCLYHFNDVLTEPGFKAFCRRSNATYRWEHA